MLTLAKTTDDRGQSVALFDHAGGRWPSPKDPRAARMYDRISTIMSESSTGLPPGALAGILPMLAFIPVIHALQGCLGRPLYWYESVAYGGGVALVLVGPSRWFLNRAMRTKTQRLSKLALDEGICPSCAYHLSDLPAQTDGCIQCPECGSAWKAESVAKHPPFDRVFGGGDGWRLASAQLRYGAFTRLVSDDRGCKRPLIHPRMRRALEDAEPALRTRLLAAKRQIGRSGLWFRLPIALFFWLGAAVVFTVLLWIPAPVGGWTVTAGVYFSCVTTALLGVAVYLGNFGYSPNRIVETMKRYQLCPSCGGDLENAVIQSDRTVSCPACSAGWTMPDRTVIRPPATSAPVEITSGPSAPSSPRPPGAPPGTA